MTLKNVFFIGLFSSITLHAMDENASLLRKENPHTALTIQNEHVDYRHKLLLLHDDILRGKKKYSDLDEDPLFIPQNYAHLSNALATFQVDGPSAHIAEYFEWKKALEKRDVPHFERLIKSFSLKLAQEIELPVGTDFFERRYRCECAKSCPAFCAIPEIGNSIWITDAASSRLASIIHRQSDLQTKRIHARLKLAQNFFMACQELAQNKEKLSVPHMVLFGTSFLGVATLASLGLNTLAFGFFGTNHPVIIGTTELVSSAALLGANLKWMSSKLPPVKMVRDLEMLVAFSDGVKSGFEQVYWQESDRYTHELL